MSLCPELSSDDICTKPDRTTSHDEGIFARARKNREEVAQGKLKSAGSGVKKKKKKKKKAMAANNTASPAAAAAPVAPITKESSPNNTPGMLSERVSSDSSAMAPPPASSQKKRGWIATLRDDIDPTNSDAPILACCFVSGLCDSVAFNASSVFVSMQTGEPDTLFPCQMEYRT